MEETEKRVFVGVRLRPSSILRVDIAAEKLHISRSELLRRAFVIGLPAVEKSAGL